MKENHLRANGGRKRVGVWIRVSTDEQAQGDSPEHHRLRAQAYADSKTWEVCEVYDLAGFSGKSVMEYPETKRMMADIRRGHITGLIFSKLARFARNTIELLTFADFFQEHGADLISLQEAIDTSTPAGRLFFSVNASLAQFEREEIASRAAASVPIRAKLGKPLGGLAPFGYKWEGKKLVPDPTDAPVRKLAYELFAEHKRKKTVARMLNERGYRTRGGGKFTDTTISRIIADPTAKGEHRLNYTKSQGDGKKWALKPEHEWIVNKVEAIVPESLWNQCNAMLEARKTKGERPARKATHAFTGFVRCSCGQPMYVPSNTPKWVCYKCRNKIPVVDLDGLFRDELRGYMVDPEKAAAFVGGTQTELATKRDLLAKLKGERDKVKFEADKCFELYNDSMLTPAQFRERFQPLDARKQEITKELPRLEGEIAALSVNELSAADVISHGASFYDRWPTLEEDAKRQIIELFLKQIVVGKEDVEVVMVSLPCLETVIPSHHSGTGALPTCHIVLRASRPKPASYPKAPQTLGEHIRRRRMDLDLLQSDVAARIGAHTLSVTNWEIGHSEPEIRFLPAILGFLGYDPRPTPETIGERLVRYRQARGWSQRRLAEALDVDPTTLSRWELGKKAPWGVFRDRLREIGVH